jgi:catechol 2,3-dioxygenase-like lactoylglutathione lyase family enzyme
LPAGALHHLELAATDLDKALEFWRWLLGELGYEPYEQWDGGESFARDDFYVVLRQANTDEPFVEGRAGLHHVAFHARSRDHVDSVTEGVRARGLTVLYEDRHPFAGGYYALYCRDPEGIKVEVVAPDEG